MYMSTFIDLKCFAYVLLFDFSDFQILVNELVTGKFRFPPAPLFDLPIMDYLTYLFGIVSNSF